MSAEPTRRIAILEEGTRFWVIPQINGAEGPLVQALDLFRAYYAPGDHFVFLGSQIGQAGASAAVIDHLFDFQAWVAGQQAPEAAPRVTWLRGIQEELMDRFYTLHFAPDPMSVLEWMASSHNFDRTLADFGCDLHAVEAAATMGAAALARHTAEVRQGIRASTNQKAYFDQCMRAAMSRHGQLLFVHGGLDPARPLAMQTDAFWWGHPDFFRMVGPYQGFSRVFSTLNPAQNTRDNPRLEAVGRLVLDGGCGRGGPLNIACFDPRGRELFAYNFI